MYKDFQHLTPVQVRFKDIDKQGHVNNANHHTYVETARISYFAQVLGTDVDWDETGLLLARVEMDYLEPIFLEDKVEVYTRVSRLGKKSFDMQNIIVKNNGTEIRECAISKSVIVCYNYHKKETIEVPAVWRNNFIKFEKQKI